MRKILNSEKEWLKERQNRITATKAAAILGLSSYKNSIDIYNELIGGYEAVEESQRMRNGKDAEEHIRSLFIIRHRDKYKLVPIGKDEFVFFVHDEYDFLGSSCDGEIIDLETNEEGILEIKFFDGYANFKTFDKDSIRDDCYAQVLHELSVSKKSFLWFIVALNYEDSILIKEYYIKKEDVKEDIDLLINTLVDFYNKYVVTKKRPPLVLNF